MKTSKTKKIIFLLLSCSLFTSCEDFLETEVPDHKMINETVFQSDETARSAMKGIYNQLSSVPFSSGGPASVTVLSGLSADDLAPIRDLNLPYLEYEQHEVSPDNFRNLSLWSSAYNIIYMSNALLEGLSNSENLSENVQSELRGEASFVRAFTYFYLVNLYGEVPLILSTDYRSNSLIARSTEEEVYQQILNDLGISLGTLDESYPMGQRTEISRYAALAMMARVQLYLENWPAAENFSSQVITQNNTYDVIEDLDQVFLMNSREAIWQLSPEGTGSILTNTQEGSTLIIHPFISFLSHIKLDDSFIDSFTEEDHRLDSWVGFHQGENSYYPFKYKINNSTAEITEYSMVLRLSEQYLVRSEARVMQNNLSGAIADLDSIRTRAGLDLIAVTHPSIDKEGLLDMIIEERERELFSEWGHRWLDLKRLGLASEFFGSEPLWEETDVLYPIPETERMKNPNLSQNAGY